MSAVVEAVSDVVGGTIEFVGDAVQDTVEFAADAIETVAETASNVVEGALEDPLGTIATVATAVYAPYLLPAVEAGKVVANGGDLDDALKAAAIAYVVPEVAKGVSTEFASSALGDVVKEAAVSTGLESLPSAITSGVGRAAAGTVSGLAQGQDFSDALTRGLTSGVGSAVGNVAGAEADTGSRLGDRLIAAGTGAATTTGLRGGSGSDAAENAIAGTLVGYGLNEVGKGLPTLASSSTTTTDAAPTPTEELMMQMQENVVDTTQNQEDAANTQALVDALYPTTEQGTVDYLSSLDALSEPPGAEVSTGPEYYGISEPSPTMVTSPTADQPGDYPQTVEEVRMFNDIFASPQATSELLGAVGDQPGDYPRQIINNPDGTSTAIEFDGTQRIFNLDGSVTKISPDGTSTTEVEAPAEASTGQSSGINLGALASSLLGSGQTGKAGGWSPSSVATMAGAGLLASQFEGADAGQQMNIGSQGFNWNQQNPYLPQNAIAYGQQFVNPTFAAQGGLMSITPTVGDMNQMNRLDSDPTNSVKMYAAGGSVMPAAKIDGNEFVLAAQKHGLNDDMATLNKIVNLVNRGMSVDQAASMLSSNKAQGGGISSLGSYSDGGRLLKGPGDGMSDHIPANISGKQPARLADGEFVIPADVVSHLGNGSTDAGAKVLYDMMSKVRKARTGKPQQGKQINPKKFTPR
jgi:hypothetical protein